MRTRIGRALAGAVAIAALALTLASCASAAGDPGGTAKAALAKPTSTAALAGEQDAKKLVSHCIPASAIDQLKLVAPVSGKSARATLMNCMGVPKADRTAAAACALANVEKGGKLPKTRQGKELALLNDAYPCVARYQPHAVPTPAASAK